MNPLIHRNHMNTRNHHSSWDPTIAQTKPNWARAPWLEQYYCDDVLKASTGPRIITTHLPYHLLAPVLQHSKAKVSRWANHKWSFITLLNFLASDKCLPFLRLYMWPEISKMWQFHTITSTRWPIFYLSQALSLTF